MTAWELEDNILEDGSMLSVTQGMWVNPWPGRGWVGLSDREDRAEGGHGVSSAGQLNVRKQILGVC